ncbi:MAG: AAA family ATPase [Phycisphaerae bacterium]|nr:AAA family ATPase [Phycisphaerae bacterium]
MGDLWIEMREQRQREVAPLAVKLRPRTIEEFVGQEHLLGEGRLLNRILLGQTLQSAIFAGPPGVGKTTLAEVIAGHTSAHFERAHAAMIGIGRIKQVIQDATNRLEDSGRRTILFLDEIHRFSRSQQDVLLDDVENGRIILIGATTENPFYAVNSALLSRSTVFQFNPLEEEEVSRIIRHAIDHVATDSGREIQVDDEAIRCWARLSDGDARRGLQALEVALGSLMHEVDGKTVIRVDLETAKESIQAKSPIHDGTGDEHYDLVSALIKSMRGSDPDAAVYWLARMLDAGEDPRFIARRIAILASEDIGNADPQALMVAEAAWSVTERVGMPECQITLSQAAIYMAMAPKSGASSQAIWAAMDDVQTERSVPVPRHLKQSSKMTTEQPGEQKYMSPHENSDGIGRQEYLEVDRNYYQPPERGFERSINERLRYIEKIRSSGRSPGDDQAGGRDDACQ